MHEHERDAVRRPTTAAPEPAAHERAHDVPERPVAPVRRPGLDAASLMHLQRTAGNQGVVQMLAGDEEDRSSPVHEVIGSGGAPLDAQTRSTMESAFGASFEGVRVHTDGQASKSAESVGASAYTVGSDVVFRSGQYDPGSATGQRTIAHELSHVVQQSQGPVDGTDAPGGIRVSDPGDRFEQAADHHADRVMASVGSGAAPAVAPGRAPSAGASVQREDDPALAAPALQRETPEEDEMPSGG